MKSTRREFIKHSAVAGGAAAVPYFWTSSRASAADSASSPIAKDVPPEKEEKPDNRPTMAAIGVGGSRGAYSQGGVVAMKASQRARMIAVCDVDDLHTKEFNAKFDNKLNMYRDYRELFEKEKPAIVTIGTPDHWHVPIAVTALHHGCDVYCEKPLTLTIEEGFLIREAVKQTGRVFQVGTQQRSEHDLLFLKAMAIIKSGRLGKKVNAHIAIGTGKVGGPFPNIAVPEGLDWNMWVGPAQKADYSLERRKEFRWYYDYSGGKMTDWGVHHVDIAQWALGQDKTGPTQISGAAKFTPLVPEHFNWQRYFDGAATLPNGYMTATDFHVTMQYADGTEISVYNKYDAGDGRTKFDNGILFVGDEGRIFVNREKLTGKIVEELDSSEWCKLYQSMIPIYKCKFPGDHMRNFFECIADRSEPISDVESHHRAMTACHLCNIALMLGRDLRWDPNAEQFLGDEQATALITRPRRKEFSWDATT